MSGFAADWLALRAGADRRARSVRIGQVLSAHFEGRPPLRVLDLGAGTGNNLAETAPALPAGSTWVLVDADPDLLARVTPPSDVAVQTCVADLSMDLEALLEAHRPDLVTASAFYDLAGADWIDRLVAAAAGHRACVHAVLSYTGAETWEPPHAADGKMLAAFHDHQRQEKGLGPALGPDAHRHLAEGLSAAGYDVREDTSDWHLERPRDAALIAELATGISEALAPILGTVAAGWLGARREASRVRIGHADLFGVPGA